MQGQIDFPENPNLDQCQSQDCALWVLHKAKPTQAPTKLCFDCPVNYPTPADENPNNIQPTPVPDKGIKALEESKSFGSFLAVMFTLVCVGLLSSSVSFLDRKFGKNKQEDDGSLSGDEDDAHTSLLGDEEEKEEEKEDNAGGEGEDATYV
jgi:hypothetical protein